MKRAAIAARNRADRYVRAGVSQRTAPAMISRIGGSETGTIQKQSGTLLVMTTGTFKDTPALDALKASCGAPISMGRGEIPVRLAATGRLFCLNVIVLPALGMSKCEQFYTDRQKLNWKSLSLSRWVFPIQ